jgi:methanogenic corrinoid protein MtbC1
VTDLGVDIAPARFYESALQFQPDILGMHGLLTTSYEPMKETVRLIRAASDPDIASLPIILGGGTVNAMVCGFVGADYWATDAMVGVDLCKQMIAKRRGTAALA